MTLLALYDRSCAEASDINEHLTTFVQLCLDLDAKVVIELGVRTGVSTAAWLHAMSITNGHVWSVDTAAAPPMPTTERWTFVRGHDLDEGVLRQLPDAADIIFIDTSHTYQHTLDELATYASRVRAGGRIACHDTEVELPDGTREEPFPVKRAIELFCAANNYVWTNSTNNNGLGIIEIPLQ